MPAGDSMPDTYIAIMLQSLKKKEQVCLLYTSDAADEL